MIIQHTDYTAKIKTSIEQIEAKLVINGIKNTDEIIHFVSNLKNNYPHVFENQFKDHLNSLFQQSIRAEGVEKNDFRLPLLFLNHGADINYKQGEALSFVCKKGYLEAVKFLLTSPELKEHADLHLRDDNALLCAVGDNHFNIVKYLLTSPELKDHANIHSDEQDILRWPISNRNLEMVKYLLTSPELKEHVDIYANDASAFEWACNIDANEIIDYFIYDYKIKLTDEIKSILREFGIDKVILKKDLEQNLSHKTYNPKKQKI